MSARVRPLGLHSCLHARPSDQKTGSVGADWVRPVLRMTSGGVCGTVGVCPLE